MVEADPRFSLRYLNTVDEVINAATDIRNNSETVERVVIQIIDRLAKSGGCKEPLDTAGDLENIASSAESGAKETIRALQKLDDTSYKPFSAEDRDVMTKSIEEAIAALQQLHDSLVDIRWVVAEHDADLEKPDGKAFDTVEDLITDLRNH